MSNLPVISINLQNFLPSEKIKKHAGEVHGMGLIAISMIDNNAQGLEISVQYNDKELADAFVKYIVDLWGLFKPISTTLRSYRVEDEFVAEYNGKKLLNVINQPREINDFHGVQVLIDVQETAVGYKMWFYRMNEQSPRILTVSF